MGNFSEKFKDILYDSMDYIMMLFIIIGIALISGWRLDALFAKDALDIADNNATIDDNQNKPIEKPNNDIDDKQDAGIDNGNNQDHNKAPDSDAKDDNKENQNNNMQDKTTITINIPEGSFPSQIASILRSNGIIEDSDEFIHKSQELGLDTKLQSGSFKITTDASLEDIIKIIAKQI